MRRDEHKRMQAEKSLERRKGSSADRIRVAIVEDDAKLLSALGQLIGTDPEFEFL